MTSSCSATGMTYLYSHKQRLLMRSSNPSTHLPMATDALDERSSTRFSAGAGRLLRSLFQWHQQSWRGVSGTLICLANTDLARQLRLFLPSPRHRRFQQTSHRRPQSVWQRFPMNGRKRLDVSGEEAPYISCLATSQPTQLFQQTMRRGCYPE